MGDLAIDNTPEITGTTDEDGRFLLTNRSANGGVTTHTGHTLHDNPFGVVDVVGRENRFLVKLSKEAHEEFIWLDITDFNLAFWQGHAISYTFTLTSHTPPPAAPASPAALSAQIEGSQATLCWSDSPSAGVIGYVVYRAAAPTYAYEPISGLVTGPCWTDFFSESNRVYALTAVNDTGQESGFSSFAWAPRLINPAAVGVTSGGVNLILDPQNGYALLRQRADGRYVQNIGSPHYHLEYSSFLAVDEQDHLIISHPGDYYTGRHSVRVADRDANPILEFGERGSGPGQFETPTGVAVWGQSCTFGGPYTVDEHTLLLLHFDGSYNGAQGQPGTPNGTTFTTGKYDQGVLVDAGDTLTYATAGNLNRTEGAIEFWLHPNWDGGDNESYTFFEVGDGWFNRMRVMKDGANNLRFMVWNSSAEYGIATNVAHWQAGEWHHIAATWQGSVIALFVDGQQVDSRDDANLPDVLADTIYVGSSLWHDQQAEATLDELRISDIPRLGNGDTCDYRILVADSSNFRIQAFDALGNFITEYGSFGGGSGQFRYPRGLAVDSNGRLLVADSGNNRLQVLNFDGMNFTFAQSITADFNWPMGVTTFGDQRIIVADTGNNLVKLLDMDGNLLTTYTGPNDGYTGPFNQPQGIVVNRLYQIVVADRGNQRVVTIAGALPLHSVYVPIVWAGPPQEENH